MKYHCNNFNAVNLVYRTHLFRSLAPFKYCLPREVRGIYLQIIPKSRIHPGAIFGFSLLLVKGALQVKNGTVR